MKRLSVFSTVASNRVSWIDNLKFFAIFMVVFHHSAAVINGYTGGMKLINLYVVAFNMYLFAFVSGITTYKSLADIRSFDNLVCYFSKTAWHIGVPTVVYTIPILICLFHDQGNDRGCIKLLFLLIIFCIASYLFKYKVRSKWLYNLFPLLSLPFCLYFHCVWYFVYIYATLLCSGICFYVSNRVGKYKPIVYFVSFGVLSFAIADYVPFVSSIEFFLSYVAGLLYYRLYRVEKVTVKKSLASFSASILILFGSYIFSLFYEVGEFYFNDIFKLIHEKNFVFFIERQLCALLLVCGTCLVVQLCSHKYNRISLIGSMTLALYPIHGQIISIIKNWFYIDYNSFYGNLLATLIFSVLLTLFSCYLISLLSRSKYLRLLLLGQ